MEDAPLATRVKAYGCYPLLPAGRRDWTSASISIKGVSEIQWPPVGWMDLSPQNRLWAAQTVIATREMKRNDGLFPDGNIAEYVDRYRWLLLNDTQKVRRDGPTPIRMTQDLRDLTDQLILADGTNLVAGDAEVIESLQMILGSKATRERFTEWLGADLCRELDDVPLLVEDIKEVAPEPASASAV